MLVNNVEISVRGRFFRTAVLRHEWFEYLQDPQGMVKQLQQGRPVADLFTFLQDTWHQQPDQAHYRETDSAAVLPITSYKEWWESRNFKVRNKIRKAQKNGLELRETVLDDELVKGVKGIYDESPIRQGRKFWHYGKSHERIKQDLSSFPGCTFFIGVYLKGELIGFMKLFEQPKIIRTVHIIAKLSQRDMPVQDALIAKAVEICDAKKIPALHYGDWSRGGLGAFKIKHGFERVDIPRYFVPLSLRGNLMLKLKLHQRLEQRVPGPLWDRLVTFRNKLNGMRYATPKVEQAASKS